MAATAWAFYNSFREKLGEGDFDLSGTSVNFTMSLHTSAASANATNAVLSTYASIANEVANAMVMQLEGFQFLEELGLLARLPVCFVLIQLPSYGLQLGVMWIALSLLSYTSLVENWCAILN